MSPTTPLLVRDMVSAGSVLTPVLVLILNNRTSLCVLRHDSLHVPSATRQEQPLSGSDPGRDRGDQQHHG